MMENEIYIIKDIDGMHSISFGYTDTMIKMPLY